MEVTVPADRRRTALEALEILNRRDLEGLAPLMDPEFTFYSAIRQMEGEVYRGADGMRSYFDSVDATWEGFRFELEEFHDRGEQSVLVLRATGTARGSGFPLEQRVAQVWTWRGDRVRQVDGYTNAADALREVG